MGTARAFNAGTSVVSAPFVAMDSGDWTIAAWINATGAGGSSQGMIAQTGDSTNAFQVFRLNSASRDVLCRQIGTSNADAVSTTVLSTGKWYAVVGTFRASDGKTRIYFGDERVPMAEMAYASQSAVSGRTSGANQLRMGNGIGASQGWNGGICNVVADTREWSLAEMESFRVMGRPPSFATSLRSWFPLEGTGATERDKSGRGADATITSNQGSQAGPGLWAPRSARSRRLVRI